VKKYKSKRPPNERGQLSRFDSDGDEPKLYQKKALGQVFLKERWPVERMADTVWDWGARQVLEIGPGLAVLTDALLAKGLHVTAVEKDDRFAALLKLREDRGEPLKIFNQDVLEFDLGEWVKSSKAPKAVLGNIPYNISTPILTWCLEQLRDLHGGLFMVQLEFAERIAAAPDTSEYGSISVFAQIRAEVALEFEVSRGCFSPVPKVDSAVLSLKWRDHGLSPELLRRTEVITRAAFNQRRKKLSNGIKAFTSELDLESSPIDLHRRPATLTPAEFIKLAQWTMNETPK